MSVDADATVAASEFVRKAALRAKLAIALHDNDCSDRHCTPTAMGAYYRQADTAIALIADEVRADERQRIRNGIENTPGWMRIPLWAQRAVADLLDEP